MGRNTLEDELNNDIKKLEILRYDIREDTENFLKRFDELLRLQHEILDKISMLI